MEEQRGLRIGGKLAALLTVQVGVEDRALVVEAFEQDHTDVRHAAAVDGCDRHGIGVIRLAPRRLLKPFAEQPQRLVGHGEITNR